MDIFIYSPKKGDVVYYDNSSLQNKPIIKIEFTHNNINDDMFVMASF